MSNTLKVTVNKFGNEGILVHDIPVGTRLFCDDGYDGHYATVIEHGESKWGGQFITIKNEETGHEEPVTGSIKVNNNDGIGIYLAVDGA